MQTPFWDSEGRMWEDATDPKMWYSRAAENLDAKRIEGAVIGWCHSEHRTQLADLLGIESTKPADLVGALIEEIRRTGSPGLLAMQKKIPDQKSYLHFFLGNLAEAALFHEDEAAG